MPATLPRLSTWLFPCLILSMLAVPNSRGADRKDIVRQARAGYYSLKSEGMAGYSCQIKPDWTFMEKLLDGEQGGNEVLHILRQVRFQVVIGPNGEATVSHQSEATPPNDAVRDRVQKIIGGLEQIISGFFQAWQGFVVTPPFPEVESDYQVVDLGQKLQLAYRQDQVGVQMSMDHNFSIGEMSIKMEQINVTIRPRFELDEGKYVLSAYDFENVMNTGEKQQGTVTIQNQKVEGLILPVHVGIKMMIGQALAEPSFDFTDFQVKKQ